MSAFEALRSEHNKIVTNRSKMLRTELRMQINKMTFKERLQLDNALYLRETKNTKTSVRSKQGLAQRIAVKFPGTIWFVETGSAGKTKVRPRPIVSLLIPAATEKLADELFKLWEDSIFDGIVKM